ANAGHLSSLPIARAFLVAEGSLHGSAFAQADGRTFIFRVADHQPWPWLDSLGCERARIATWGSVATTAFSTAMALGCNPIVFIGADFAFTDERPYCRGTSFEPVWASWIAGGKSIAEIWKFLVERWPLEPAIDVNGNPVRTARHLVSFRDWIVERAAERPDRRIVNATAAGILAGPAIVQATAATTLAVHQPVDRDAILAALKRAHRASRGDAARLFEGVAAILSDPAAAAVDDWTAFADGIDRRAIEAALRSPEFQAWTLGARAGGSKERS
ncbi:MAG TPA: 6-hydroxymethylpterin diphosphokinase MptE-like protein, partial [Vicinamibacterales bacterium]|nr:6-hydroxymethylpterin diphosphokinase MptE-like protein [Vicinamibacterales bacterium]